jgi:hypothetical protein
LPPMTSRRPSKKVETAKPGEAKASEAAKSDVKAGTAKPQASKTQTSRLSEKTHACRYESDEEGAPHRREVQRLLVMRKFFIVAVMFWLALSCQNNHRDFGPPDVAAAN